MNRGVNIKYLPGTLFLRFQHDVYCVCQASGATNRIVLSENRPKKVTVTFMFESIILWRVPLQNLTQVKSNGGTDCLDEAWAAAHGAMSTGAP